MQPRPTARTPRPGLNTDLDSLLARALFSPRLSHCPAPGNASRPGAAAFPLPRPPHPALASGSQHKAAFPHLLLHLNAKLFQFSQCSSPAGHLRSDPRCDSTLPRLWVGSELPGGQEWAHGAAWRWELLRSWGDASLQLALPVLALGLNLLCEAWPTPDVPISLVRLGEKIMGTQEKKRALGAH